MRDEYYDINYSLYNCHDVPNHVMQGFLVNNGLANSCDEFWRCADVTTLDCMLFELLDKDEIYEIGENSVKIILNRDACKEDTDYLTYIFHLVFIKVVSLSYYGNVVNINFKFLFSK